MLQAELVTDPLHDEIRTNDISKLSGAVQIRRIPDDVIMDMGLIRMCGIDKSMVFLGVCTALLVLSIISNTSSLQVTIKFISDS